MTASICRACTHPNRDAIDHELTGSGSVRSVAQRWGIPRSSMQRHFANHVKARLRRAMNERKNGSDPDLLTKLLELTRITKGILAKAYNDGDLDVALKAIARAERQLELEGRLTGELKDGGATTNVLNVQLTPEQGERMAKLFLERRQIPAAPAAIPTTAASDTEGEP